MLLIASPLLLFNILSLCLAFVSLISMCLGVFLLGFILYGTFCASWTWLAISFSLLWKFSTLIPSKIFSYPFFFSSSGTPIIRMLVCLILCQRSLLGFPGGWEDKASACNAGDPGSTPGLGRSPGEGNGNPLQYSCLKNPTDRGAWMGYIPRGHKELDTTEWLHFTSFKRSLRLSSVLFIPLLFFILLFRSYFHHFIFQLTDSFLCFRYFAVDSF